MLTRWLGQDKIESGKKNREGTAPEFRGSFLSGDPLSRAPKSNSLVPRLRGKGSNINRAKSCPTDGGKLKDASKDDSRVYIYVLSVLDTASKSLIKSFPNVSSATFSADSTCMAYFADYFGRLEGEAPPGYEEGVWLYNFETKLNKKIAKAAIDINWAEFDGNIYILYGHEVTCYNTKTDRVESTSYKGIYFSPNGEYYASKIDPEGPYWTIYRASDNQEMTEWMNTIRRKGGDLGVYDFQFWSKKLKAVVFRISNSENLIFDIEQGKTIGCFEGIFIGTNYDGSMVAVHPIIKEKPGVDFSKAKIIDLTKFKK